MTLFNIIEIDHDMVRHADAACHEHRAPKPPMRPCGDHKARGCPEITKSRINIFAARKPVDYLFRRGSHLGIHDINYRAIAGFQRVAGINIGQAVSANRYEPHAATVNLALLDRRQKLRTDKGNICRPEFRRRGSHRFVARHGRACRNKKVCRRDCSCSAECAHHSYPVKSDNGRARFPW